MKEVITFIYVVLAGMRRMDLREALTKGRKTYERAFAKVLPRDPMGLGEDHDKNKQQVIIWRQSQQDLVISGCV